MGFLSGAYGKIMAGKYLRDLQHKQTLVTARVRRVTKEVANMEKSLTRMEKQVNANMQYQMQSIMLPIMQQTGINPASGQFINSNINSQSDEWKYYTATSQALQQQMALAQSMWAEQFDMIRESMLQPLKDEEDSLQTELDSLKSQILIAEQEYKAKQEEEKSGAQNLKPDYTGNG